MTMLLLDRQLAPFSVGAGTSHKVFDDGNGTLVFGFHATKSTASWRSKVSAPVVVDHTFDYVWDTALAVPQPLQVFTDQNEVFEATSTFVNGLGSVGGGTDRVSAHVRLHAETPVDLDFYLATDVHGSTIPTESTARFVRAAGYDEFGNPAGPVLNNPQEPALGYRGELQTVDTIHLRARTYTPWTSRFTVPDPLDGVDGTPTVANGYHYGDNDPLGRFDPSGLRASDTAMALDACAVSAAGDPDHEYRFFSEAGTYGDWTMGANTCGFFYCSGPWGACGAQAAAPHIVGAAEFVLEFLPGYDCYQTVVNFSWGHAAFCGLDLVPGVGRLDEAVGVLRVTDDLVGHGDEIVARTRGAGRAAGALCSFSADTPVLMADGDRKAIADVDVGDRVLATDPETGESGPREVVATLPHTDQLLTLRLSSGDVITTEDHKYWNATDQAWQESQHLDPGDRLLTADERGDSSLRPRLEHVRCFQSERNDALVLQAEPKPAWLLVELGLLASTTGKVKMGVCPVCGFDHLELPPWNDDLPSDEICPCCGTHFGYDDAAGGDPRRREQRWKDLRQVWLAEGSRWWSLSRPPPDGWNPVDHVAKLSSMEP